MKNKFFGKKSLFVFSVWCSKILFVFLKKDKIHSTLTTFDVWEQPEKARGE
jgi:hypothetical protein